MKSTFTLEWADDLGPEWMNKYNLQLVLDHYWANEIEKDRAFGGRCPVMIADEQPGYRKHPSEMDYESLRKAMECPTAMKSGGVTRDEQCAAMEQRLDNLEEADKKFLEMAEQHVRAITDLRNEMAVHKLTHNSGIPSNLDICSLIDRVTALEAKHGRKDCYHSTADIKEHTAQLTAGGYRTGTQGSCSGPIGPVSEQPDSSCWVIRFQAPAKKHQWWYVSAINEGEHPFAVRDRLEEAMQFSRLAALRTLDNHPEIKCGGDLVAGPFVVRLTRNSDGGMGVVV